MAGSLIADIHIRAYFISNYGKPRGIISSNHTYKGNLQGKVTERLKSQEIASVINNA